MYIYVYVYVYIYNIYTHTLIIRTLITISFFVPLVSLLQHPAVNGDIMYNRKAMCVKGSCCTINNTLGIIYASILLLKKCMFHLHSMYAKCDIIW